MARKRGRPLTTELSPWSSGGQALPADFTFSVFISGDLVTHISSLSPNFQSCPLYFCLLLKNLYRSRCLINSHFWPSGNKRAQLKVHLLGLFPSPTVRGTPWVWLRTVYFWVLPTYCVQSSTNQAKTFSPQWICPEDPCEVTGAGVVGRQEWEPGELEHKPAGAARALPMHTCLARPWLVTWGHQPGWGAACAGPAMAIEPSLALSLIQNWQLLG